MTDIPEEDIKRIARAAISEYLTQAVAVPREDLSAIAAASARMAVNEAHVKLFAQLGFDMANMDDIKKLRANLDFVQYLRLGSANIGRAVTTAIATVVVGAFLALIWLGARLSFGTPPHIPPLK